MITTVTLDNAAGSPITLHEVSGTAKRALISAKGLSGIGPLRASKRVRPSAHGSINETRYEEGTTVTLEGEITGSTVAEAFSEFRAVTQPMLETLDSGAALLKWEETGGQKLQQLVKLDGDIEPLVSGVAPRLVYQVSLFAEDPRAYSQTLSTAKGSGLTGSAIEGTFVNAVTPPLQVAVDAGHIYWVDRKTKAIGRAAIGGGTIEKEWIKPAGGGVPWSVAVDAAHIYWGVSGVSAAIGRAAIGGTSIESEWLKTETTVAPQSIAVNASNIYYTWNNSSGAYVGKAALAGTGNESQFQFYPREFLSSVVLDATYFYLGGSSTIRRCTLAGAEVTILINGTNWVTGLAVNATNIFWVNKARTIGRAKLAGTESNFSFIPGLNSEPAGLALNTEHLYWGESTGYLARSKEIANGGPKGSAVTATNGGNRPSPVKFKIAGPILNPAVVNKAGARVSLVGTIASGNYVELDTQKRTVLLNGTGNLLSFLDAQNTEWGAFEAPAGSETYELVGTSATAATLEVLYRSAYS